MTPPRPGSAQSRTIALLDLVDDCAKEYGTADSEMVALRHLVEWAERTIQQHPLLADGAEAYAVRCAEALDLIERES